MPDHIDWKRPQPAPKRLSSDLKSSFPQITQTGIYNDRYIAGTTKKSAHAEGRALDVHLNATQYQQREIGNALFRMLIGRARQSGISVIIWNRQIWSTQTPSVHPYKGVSPHTDHLHIEFTREGSQQTILRAIEMGIAEPRTGLEDLNWLKLPPNVG